LILLNFRSGSLSSGAHVIVFNKKAGIACMQRKLYHNFAHGAKGQSLRFIWFSLQPVHTAQDVADFRGEGHEMKHDERKEQDEQGDFQTPFRPVAPGKQAFGGRLPLRIGFGQGLSPA
jgi:hypothetical protein